MIRLNIQFFAEEKTEKATPRKRDESRKKGQVAKSADIVTALSLFSMFLFFLFAIPYMGHHLAQLMTDTFTNGLAKPLTKGGVAQLFTGLAIESGKIVAPILVVSFVIAIVANVIQIGFMFSTEAISVKLNRLDPISGFKRIYSIRALVEFLKSLLKISAIGFCTFLILWMNMDQIMMIGQKSVGEALVIVGKITLEMGMSASIILLFLAILDYLYQKYDFEKNIRMSKKEIKDEYKKTEGDPLIKSKIRERQRQMAMRRMMQEVPKADVVITNPTHYAVALIYKDGEMDAPVIVAKGADYVALKIREIAKENGVTIVEKRELARALFPLDIGSQVPEEFFKAVAEILAYVYQLKGKKL
jgi:flagellar biosynthesis protein FlhB